MRCLLVASDLGITPDGRYIPGGLQQFGRCVGRVLASAPGVDHLTVWSLVDSPGAEVAVTRLLAPHASKASMNARAFGGRRIAMTLAMVKAIYCREFDTVMYLLVNQSTLGLIPGHPKYSVWLIGREMFDRLSPLRRKALASAAQIFSISRNTSDVASRVNPGFRPPKIVYPCVEPGSFEIRGDLIKRPSLRRPAVLIVGSMHPGLMYKGHAALVSAWPRVLAACPAAELWIVGGGAARPTVESLAAKLPDGVRSRIQFFGPVDESSLTRLYASARVFAMPSGGEGFGLVYAEAAKFGLPCIAGRNDSGKEVVIEGATGLLVEQDPAAIAEACIALLANDDMADAMGERGRQRTLQCFTFDRFRDRLLQAMETVDQSVASTVTA
jgi:phosphatidylinositol alpha-1,6-mannosyltransferase